jgi:flagellar FliL protein
LNIRVQYRPKKSTVATLRSRQKADLPSGLLTPRVKEFGPNALFSNAFFLFGPGIAVARRCDYRGVMKKIIIIAAAAVVFLGGGGAGVYFFMPDLLPEFIRPKDAAHGKEANKHAEKKHEPEIGADLEVFVVNLAGPAPGRYLRTTLSLGVKSEKEKEEIKESSGPIRHAIVMYLTDRKVEELLEPEGKNKIRAELLKQVNAAIGKKIVANVYFKEFLIQ